MAAQLEIWNMDVRCGYQTAEVTAYTPTSRSLPPRRHSDRRRSPAPTPPQPPERVIGQMQLNATGGGVGGGGGGRRRRRVGKAWRSFARTFASY